MTAAITGRTVAAMTETGKRRTRQHKCFSIGYNARNINYDRLYGLNLITGFQLNWTTGFSLNRTTGFSLNRMKGFSLN